MKRGNRALKWSGAFIALVAGASCSESPLQPISQRDATGLKPQLTVYNPSTKTLGVTTGGIGKIESENGNNWFTYTASVTGGVRPFKMYWFVEICYTDGYCSNRTQVAAGTDLDSVDIWIPSDAKWLKIIPVVGDSQSESFTGWFHKTVIGPASDVPGSFAFPCTEDVPSLWPGETWYPFHDGQGWFYWKTCSQERVYQQ